MIGDIRLIEEVAISGDIFVFDIGNLTLNQIAKLVNPLLKRTLQATEVFMFIILINSYSTF